ncbi:ABC transporter permease [Pseudoxanthomonas composti]|uniref:FtsX-like permease family protein n=1 Tax=Pseudoxanthomonas composti TaxID=2137479 RepID=A0A4Q1JTS5_9GAMM|nr:ABC transporter permease [Pseudoxanthomonas composti]RXR02064.1 FtsX-like permease family protein [Pseudoxanthomonas composti]
MDIRPILSTLSRHKTAAALIVLEIALSCAIICNAVFLISQRIESISTTTGIAEDELIRIQITGIGQDERAMALTREDLAALRAIPGVKQAEMTNQVPLVNSSWNTSVNSQPDTKAPGPNATMYMGGPAMHETLGLKLVAGRALTPEDYQAYDDKAGFRGIKPGVVVITKALAERLFPKQDPLGKMIYGFGQDPVRIVGVLERLVRPNVNGWGKDESNFSMILPVALPYTMGGNYLIRADASRRQEVMEAAVKALQANSNSRIVLEQQLFGDIRADFYRQDRSMAWMLTGVCLALLIVTALGIVGLASFWVQQRTKQIGIRRALGATRGQILQYFQTENFLLASIGIVLGMVLAYGINHLLMSRYELPRLPLIYLPVGAISLWVLGQLAVLGPARHAAAVPPAIATRSA